MSGHDWRIESVKQLLCGFLFLLFASHAYGQANEPRRFDIGWNLLGYSRQGDRERVTGNLSFSVHVTKRVAVVADVSLHTPILGDEELVTYRFGPRFKATHGNRITGFAQVLAGGARHTDKVFFFVPPSSSGSVTSHVDGFSLGAGGGVDVGIRPWFAFRVVQVDYNYVHLASPIGNSNGVSIAAGVVFRFGKM
jgi:hypothetical protein